MTAIPRADLALKPEPKMKAEPSADKVVTSFRLPPKLQHELKELAEFWTEQDREIAKAIVGDPDRAAVTTVTDVVVRLLSSGVAGAWADVGGKPGNKTDRAALHKRAASDALKQSQSK